jgi:hypothetical protein
LQLNIIYVLFRFRNITANSEFSTQWVLKHFTLIGSDGGIVDTIYRKAVFVNILRFTGVIKQWWVSKGLASFAQHKKKVKNQFLAGTFRHFHSQRIIYSCN